MISNKNGYIPTADAEKAIWFNNFSTKIGTYAPSVNITAAEVTAIHNDCAMFLYMMNMLDVFKQALQNITQYKNLLKHAVAQQHLPPALPVIPALNPAPAFVPEGAFDRVSKFVSRIKASTNYTSAMGQDLNIIAPVQNLDVSTLQPSLTVKLDAGRPHIKCAKDISDAIDLWVDRKDNAGFVFIARLPKPDFIDTQSLAQGVQLAEWDYKAQYVIGNDNVGVMSSVVSIIVKKM